MERHRKFFYMFLMCVVAYEALNRPVIQLEASGDMNTVEYQILFQLMFGSGVFAFICLLELYRCARRSVKQSLNMFTRQRCF